MSRDAPSDPKRSLQRSSVSAIAASSAFVLSVFAAPSLEVFFGIVIWLSLFSSIFHMASLMMGRYLRAHIHHTLASLHHTLGAHAKSVSN
jgi:hypothetical protein